MARILATDDLNFLDSRACAILKVASHDVFESNNRKACLDTTAEQSSDALFYTRINAVNQALTV